MAEIFKPFRGTQTAVDRTEIREGQLLFAYDSGRIYLDKNGVRYLMSSKASGGGSGLSGTGIIYANGSNTQIIPEDLSEHEPVNFLMDLAALEDPVAPEIDNLILNSDGRFFRVLGYDIATEKISVKLLAVSGTGGGTGGGGSVEPDVNITWDNATIATGHTYIYGQNFNAVFTPTTTAAGDTTCNVTFNIIDIANNTTTSIVKNGLPSGVPFDFDTSILPESSNITLQIIVTSDNSQYNYGLGYQRNITGLHVVTMGIKKVSEKYIPLISPEDISGALELQYIPIGDKSITETLHISIDNVETGTQIIDPSWYNRDVTVSIPRQSHGTHIIEMKISAEVNGHTIYTQPIVFEAAWASSGIDTPVIWIGKYDPLVINYENSYISYMVYDPVSIQQGLSASVQLYKNGIIVSELALDYSTTNWIDWDISSLYEVGTNVFSIVCRGERKNIVVEVTEEGSRDLSLAKKDSLLENFSAAGRSSLEIKSTRGVWNDLVGDYSANLINFNWQNNGWKKDSIIGNQIDNGTYLSVANGASLSFPVPSLRLNFDKDYSIEVRFRVRNVQKYSTLVTTLPKYFYEVEDEFGNKIKSSTSETMSWINTNNKRVWYDEYGSPLMDEENVEKTYETNTGVICKWMNDSNYGLVLGSQEAYFRSQRGIISVRYKEDEVINISCVISKSDGLVYLYLNGILSGADSLPPAGQTGQFTINSPFIFNSDYCDVDIYRFRVFQSGLTMPNVIHNYLSDMHSVKLYDQNQLTDALDPTQLSYDLLIRYNEEHPDELTMPYAVWKIKTGERNEKLPFFKGDGCKADITFVNPIADKLLNDGNITPWDYYGHSPSYYSTDVDIDVQGTSSQGYPRRNYKTKFKKASSWVFTAGPLAGYSMTKDYYFYKNNGQLVTVVDDEENVIPLQDDSLVDSATMNTLVGKFHMDNQNIGVNKFTWKIDYMESSGSYNTGFANLLGNLQYPLYTKHPIQDLGLDGTGLRTTVYGYPVLTFHEYEDVWNNPSNPGVKYEYIGRYNLNLDKSANEAYGFELKKKNPYLNKNLKDIAECWELEDNQGTWCSFKFPNAAAREIGFGTSQEGYPNRMEAFRHFEYRYSPYGDQLDAIGADGKYDGKVPDDKPEIGEQIGSNEAQKTAYARDKYYNLERLFFWLDSTDATNAPASDGDRTIYIREPIRQSDGSIIIQKTAKDFVEYNTAIDYSGKDGVTSTQQPNGGYRARFTLDIPEYRLEKFRNEFSKHLDLEYCLVYFVLTELLLCYDSRGKNMMLASFGPREENGEYIWYPMFYDIDTQLGLNNSGSYLWDYDADVTLEGLFSTPGSVLWTNLYAMFQDEIKNKYRVFRGSDDGSNVKNNLSYEKITGAYECNPNIFGSYAMMGIRPIIAIGLDEYYKYFATTKTGYFDTSGIKIIEDTPNFAYCCQGDKKLTTELLLRNRLNYIDSWWLGGDYEITKVKQGQFWGRVNGNRLSATSDKFLNLTPEELASDNKYAGFKSSNGVFPIPYIDAQPNYTLKPFLKQYVTYYTDEVPEIPIKYSATQSEQNGITVIGSESTLKPYRDTPESPQDQLTYLPGVDYLSSMGDLSTLYFNEFHLTAGKRLLDLIVGSDVPGYENGLLDTNRGFDLSNGAGSSTPKSLMKKVVLTQMTAFDKTVPMQGSEKLEEFRALGTKLKGVYFAKGAPLHTVHLPESITGLELSENQELKQIITSKPIIAKWVDKTTRNEIAYNSISDFSQVEVEYANPDTYRGLYLEKITDYNTANANTGHNLSTLVIEGGGLKYGSYQILDNLIKLKDKASENNTLSISLKEVSWTPYILVESGEAYNEQETYYKLNDHSMFDAYVPETDAQWTRDTLNGLIYTYDNTANKDIITDTSLLDKLIEQYETAKENEEPSQFSNTAGLSIATIPTITGTMFIANKNGTAIPESKLTGVYASKEYFPNLQIQAEKVAQANVTKYVRLLDNGVEELIEQPLRSDSIHPLAPVSQPPARAGYDFIGWSTDTAGENILLPYEIDINTGNGAYIDLEEHLNSFSFTEEITVLTLYAQFVVHKNVITIYTGNERIGAAIVNNGSTFTNPDYIYDYVNDKIDLSTGHPYEPYKDDLNLDLTQTYKFIGYSTLSTDTTSISKDKEVPAIITSDITIYSIFQEDSVYSKILDEKYLTAIPLEGTDCELQFNFTKSELLKSLKGKVTLPIQINGYNVVTFSSGGRLTSEQADMIKNITHIFWEKPTETKKCYVKNYAARTFDSLKTLLYIEIPKNETNDFSIGQSCFSSCTNLFNHNKITSEAKQVFMSRITAFRAQAFNNISPGRAEDATGMFLSNTSIVINSNASLANLIFAGSVVSEVYFGSAEKPFVGIFNVTIPIFREAGYGTSFLDEDFTPVNIVFYYDLDVATEAGGVEAYKSNIETILGVSIKPENFIKGG